MRRLSLALALIGAVAAGCSMSGPAATSSGTAEGVQGEYWYVNLFTPPVGGYITSDVGGINCGAASVAVNNAVTPPQYSYTWIDGTRSACGTVANKQTQVAWSQAVVLTATPAAGKVFFGWAGDCKGVATTCTLTAGADKTVVALFGVAGQAHVGFEDGAVHGPAAIAFASSAAGALDCTACHGEAFQGQGIAPSCASCHAGKPHFQFDGVAFTTGPSVSALCVKCHGAQAREMLASNHFTWLGASTSVGHTTPASIGKRNVINNFCVANASNESRCMQCHPSYSTAPSKDPVTGAAAANTGPMYNWAASAAVDLSKIDCVICHANLATSKYVKSPGGFGKPWIANSGSCSPACSAAQICSMTDSAGLAWTDGVAHCRAPVEGGTGEVVAALNAAANSVGASKRNNCGFCHFNAGGGDNVKMGDLGTALVNPTQAVDVHMGSTASYAPQTCIGCHQSGSHSVRGSGLSIPVDNEGRFTCTDCHSGIHAPVHPAGITPHLDFIACQTCHIPTFSRTQFTKMNWDWQTAGDKQACQGLAGCVGFGSLTYPAGNAQSGVIAGVGGEAPKGAALVPYPSPIEAASIEQAYDWKKGISTYARGVVPAYRLIAPSTQQQGTHETTARDGLLGAGTPADPFRLSDPLPPPAPLLAGWKIAPFKRMTGRTPAFADNSAMIVPHVFGSDSLWQNTLTNSPVVPNTLGSAANPWTQAKADAIWTGVNNYGAAAAGQVGAPVARVSGGQLSRDAGGLVTVNTVADLPATLPATLFLVGAEASFPSGAKVVTRTGTRQFTYAETGAVATSTQFVAFYTALAATDWKWANTVMYINLNHEVAPVATALTCANCHPSMGGTIATSRMRELYNLTAGGCEDPVDCSKR